MGRPTRKREKDSRKGWYLGVGEKRKGTRRLNSHHSLRSTTDKCLLRKREKNVALSLQKNSITGMTSLELLF